MARLGRSRDVSAAGVGRGAMILWLTLGLAACDTTPTGPGSPFVLTTRGDLVQSNAPPGVEVTLGSKLVHPADEPAGFD